MNHHTESVVNQCNLSDGILSDGDVFGAALIHRELVQGVDLTVRVGEKL